MGNKLVSEIILNKWIISLYYKFIISDIYSFYHFCCLSLLYFSHYFISVCLLAQSSLPRHPARQTSMILTLFNVRCQSKKNVSGRNNEKNLQTLEITKWPHLFFSHLPTAQNRDIAVLCSD